MVGAGSLVTGRRRRPRETHYQQARTGLQSLLVALAHAGEVRLPPEDQLAQTLGFSRPTIRSALRSLQSEGKIHRVHGLGTFINRYALRLGANLAEDRPFLDLIEGLGNIATVEIRRMAIEPMPSDVLARVGSMRDDAKSGHGKTNNGGEASIAVTGRPGDGIVIERLFKASGRPAVFSRDLLPCDRVELDTADLDAGRSTFAFLEDRAGARVRYSVADIRAVGADTEVAAALDMALGTPVLLLDHLHVDQDDLPVGVTRAYVDQDIIPFSQVRTAGEL